MKIRVVDGGDGSTFITLTLNSGKEVHLNPEISHDEAWEAVITEDGRVIKTEYLEDYE